MRRRMAALAMVVLAGACGSTARLSSNQIASGESSELGDVAGTATTAPGATDVETAAGASATGGRTATTARGQRTGVTATTSGRPVTSAIELGFVRTGTSNAAAFGASLGGTISEADIDEAMVAAFNDKGGIAGRRITPVYSDTDTGSASWSADFARACANFTQDHNVAAVLGYVFTHDESFEACLAKKGIPHLSTTFNVPDGPTLARYPLLLALATPRIERRSIAKIDGALTTGAVSSASKVGVITDACPGTKSAWEKTIKPYMTAKALNVVATFEIGCANGSGDAAAEAGRAGNLILQFRAAGVDTVMFTAVSEGPALFIFAGGAEAQGYRPRYIVSSLANAAILSTQIPSQQAANVYGYGWLPVQDVKPAFWPSITAPAQRCLAMLKTKNITPTSPADYALAFSTCEAMFLYEGALKANQGRSSGSAIVASIEALGTGYTSVLNLDGRSTFGPGRHDAPSLARYFGWTPNCSCFTYRPTMVPMP